MNHDEFRQVVHDYLEGTLPPARREQIERHLEVSSAAREYIGEIEALDRLLPSFVTPPPSPDFPRRVIRRIREAAEARTAPPHGRSRVFRIPLPVAVAAAVLLTVSLGFNALWLVYSQRVEELRDRTEVATPSREIPFVPVGWARDPAFYLYLDPAERELHDEDEPRIFP